MSARDDWDDWENDNSPGPFDDAAALERAVHSTETAAQSASRILRESALKASMSIVHLATRSENERVRLNAAQYVVEHALLASAAGADTLNAEEQLQIMARSLEEVITRLGHDPRDPVTRGLVRETLLSLAESTRPVLGE